jgi:hypothetical protein
MPKEATEKSKTFTNWRLLEDMNLLPVRVTCMGYKNTHPSDLSCHTNIVPNGANLEAHTQPEHGGGWFHVKFRVSDGKKSPMWRELEERGLEIQELFCPHCREQVPLQARRILAHLNNHPGATRVNLFPQTLCLSLGKQKPDSEEFDGLYTSEE